MAAPALRPPRGFPALDGIRGLAAVGILLLHALGIYGSGAQDAWIRPWVLRLDVAVPVFVVLSGFLLYRPFVLARMRGAPRPSLTAYGLRRLARILPGYWVALTLSVIVLGVPGVLTATGVVRYYGLLQGYELQTAAGGLPQAWSLGLEAAFYAVLPLIVLAGARTLRGRGGLRGELAILAVLVAASLAVKVVLLAAVLPPRFTALEPLAIALPTVFDHFALGMALAVLSAHWAVGGTRGRALGARPWAWWTLAACAFALSCFVADLDVQDPRGFSHAQWAWRHALHGAVAVLLVAPAVAGGSGSAGWLASRPMRRLGLISFGVFLYHLTVLNLLGRWNLAGLEDVVPRQILWPAAALAGALVLGELSWRLVEAPVLRRVPRDRRARPVPGARPAAAPEA